MDERPLSAIAWAEISRKSVPAKRVIQNPRDTACEKHHCSFRTTHTPGAGEEKRRIKGQTVRLLLLPTQSHAEQQ